MGTTQKIKLRPTNEKRVWGQMLVGDLVWLFFVTVYVGVVWMEWRADGELQGWGVFWLLFHFLFGFWAMIGVMVWQCRYLQVMDARQERKMVGVARLGVGLRGGILFWVLMGKMLSAWLVGLVVWSVVVGVMAVWLLGFGLRGWLQGQREGVLYIDTKKRYLKEYTVLVAKWEGRTFVGGVWFLQGGMAVLVLSMVNFERVLAELGVRGVERLLLDWGFVQVGVVSSVVAVLMAGAVCVGFGVLFAKSRCDKRERMFWMGSVILGSVVCVLLHNAITTMELWLYGAMSVLVLWSPSWLLLGNLAKKDGAAVGESGASDGEQIPNSH
ncbi:MAG: hypothetical protein FWD76_03875 [Firmicutes bacterium]|nr:hypothetical protein [Bacillota bacterium]